jgi:hypothetical protein
MHYLDIQHNLHNKQLIAVQMRKSKLARNQDNVSEWDDMSIRGLLRQ